MFVNQLHQGGIRALLDYDSTIFDEMSLPEGIDLQEVVDTIIFKYGDTPLFSPDPAVMKYYVKAWSLHRLPLWERFKAAVEAEYNPLENYDRTEDSSIELTHGHKIVTNDDLTHGEKIITNDDLTHGLTVENQISADNESTYQPDNKGINSGKDERDLDETHSGKDERDFDETHSGTDKTVNKSHIHGNIGVTTSQQMLASELDLIPRLDVVDYIADDFHSEFCLMIY